MKILRKTKNFTEQGMDQLTPRDLQLENMRMQRQILINQRTKEKLEADRVKARMRNIQNVQRMELQRDIQDDKNRIQTQKMDNAQNTPRNVGLYKNKTSVVQPVSMPK